MRWRMAAMAMGVATGAAAGAATAPRAHDLGIRIGVLAPGPLNAITDVAGVRVGHVTLRRGKAVNTGVTAILPHGGNMFEDKVPAGVAIANAFGKFAGSTQVRELGEIETPILLTNTLNVAEAMAGAIEWTLDQPGNGAVRSVNAVVGETNDAGLNDIRGRHVTKADARRAIEAAREGRVEEGNVGAGTGTIAFGWKGGIGTASRRLPARLGGWTVGVLVQSNYGGNLTIAGVPVGVLTGRYDLKPWVEGTSADGSVVIVVATDAPLSDRNLERLAARAFAGIARTGGSFSNGSGDYAIAFSTAQSVRRTAARRAAQTAYPEVGNDATSPLFQAVAEASEEAALNSMLAATTVEGAERTIEALPVARVLPLLDAAGARRP